MRNHLRHGMAATGLAFGLVFGPTGHGQAQTPPVDSAKVGLIRNLLEITGAVPLMVSTMEASLPAQRAANPEVPSEFWDDFMARAREEAPKLVELLIPVYAEHFTAGQLTELVAFYRTPLGQHLNKVQPLIVEQSLKVGQDWGEALGEAVAQDLASRLFRTPPG